MLGDDSEVEETDVADTPYGPQKGVEGTSGEGGKAASLVEICRPWCGCLYFMGGL